MRGPSPDALGLAGRGVVVLGASGHLGSATVRALARAGAVVVAAARKRDDLDRLVRSVREEVPGAAVIGQPADLVALGEVEAAFDRAEAEAGPLYGFLCLAGAPLDAPDPRSDPERLRTALVRGVGDVILASEAAAERMRPRRSGSIVLVGSIYAVVSPDPRLYESAPEFESPPGYGAAKAGLLQYARHAACRLGRFGIRVNALSPGPFPRREVRGRETFARALAARTALGRVGEPEEFAGAAIFLLSDLSRFVTGHNLVVDGGFTAW